MEIILKVDNLLKICAIQFDLFYKLFPVREVLL